MTGTADPSLGDRVAEFRRHRGLSQRDLAALMKRSESWVSQVERGVQPVERVSMLQTLAQVLGVTVRDLLPGGAAELAESSDRPNDLEGLRLELSGHPALASLFAERTPPTEPTDVGELAEDVEHVWTLAHESRFADLSDALTDLLPRLEDVARRPDDRNKQLQGLRARAYQAAAAAFARQDEPDAAWVAADRAIAAAEMSGQPLQVIAGHFRMAHAFIRLRRFDQAERVTTSALDTLRPLAGAPTASAETLALYGAMHLVQAVISGQESDRQRARAHLAEAKRVGDRLGEDRNDFDTEFGPTNVQLHTVAVAVDLGDAGEALDVARTINAQHLSPERQARLLIDVARAHTQRRHIGEATAALLNAESLAPEHVRSHHLVHATIKDLMTQAGGRPPNDLAQLARRSAVTA